MQTLVQGLSMAAMLASGESPAKIKAATGKAMRMIPKSGIRFSEKIMRHVKLARDRTQNRCPLLLIALA